MDLASVTYGLGLGILYTLRDEMVQQRLVSFQSRGFELAVWIVEYGVYPGYSGRN